MPDERDANLASLARQILDYLESHPRAADSREGIARWWLADTSRGSGPEELQQVLDDLVDRGLVQRRQAAGSEAVYSRAEHDTDSEQ